VFSGGFTLGLGLGARNPKPGVDWSERDRRKRSISASRFIPRQGRGYPLQPRYVQAMGLYLQDESETEGMERYIRSRCYVVPREPLFLP